VEEATARTFVAAFYSSLARGTELSHEKLEGKPHLLRAVRGIKKAITLTYFCAHAATFSLPDMAEEAATPGGLNEQVRYEYICTLRLLWVHVTWRSASVCSGMDAFTCNTRPYHVHACNAFFGDSNER
jgi:hypothetical protein